MQDRRRRAATLRLDEVPLFGAGLAVAVAADVVQREEQMMLLVKLGWQLNLKLWNKPIRHTWLLLTYTHKWRLSPCRGVSYFVVEFGVLLVM